jgi:hypothetical protein
MALSCLRFGRHRVDHRANFVDPVGREAGLLGVAPDEIL